MESPLLQRLADKKITKDELFKSVAANFDLLPEIFGGVSSPKAALRYGCASILVDLTAKYPEKLYPYMDRFIFLLESSYRILMWNAMAAIANLCIVDGEKRFDEVYDKYFSLLNNEYLVTVANVVGNVGKIAQAKPYLIPKMTEALLQVENHPTTQHITSECKRVLDEKVLDSFSQFFAELDAKDKSKVLAFARRCVSSPRETLKVKAEKFLEERRHV